MILILAFRKIYRFVFMCLFIYKIQNFILHLINDEIVINVEDENENDTDENQVDEDDIYEDKEND